MTEIYLQKKDEWVYTIPKNIELKIDDVVLFQDSGLKGLVVKHSLKDFRIIEAKERKGGFFYFSDYVHNPETNEISVGGSSMLDKYDLHYAKEIKKIEDLNKMQGGAGQVAGVFEEDYKPDNF